MNWEYNDGGRFKYFSGDVSDCVTRSFAIGLDKDYLSVYELINKICNQTKSTEIKTCGDFSSSADGIYSITIKKIGMFFGLKYIKKNGLTKNLKYGNYLVHQYGHMTCIKNGIVYDVMDCSTDKYIGYFKL